MEIFQFLMVAKTFRLSHIPRYIPRYLHPEQRELLIRRRVIHRWMMQRGVKCAPQSPDGDAGGFLLHGVQQWVI